MLSADEVTTVPTGGNKKLTNRAKESLQQNKKKRDIQVEPAIEVLSSKPS